MMTIAQALTKTQQQLANSDTARLDAELLLAHVIGRDRVYLFTWPERELASVQETCLAQLAGRRIQGEPIAYIVGKKEFWSLTLDVNSTTLIPRPETELLVELALQKLPADGCKIIDLGTGTGAIALALAKERPQWQVIASDETAQIVELAKANACALGLEKITFVVSDWFDNLVEKDFDLVISNPPYVDADDVHLSQGDVRFEPKSALVAAKQGLFDIETIIANAKGYLKPQGWLMLEHGYNQGESVRNIFADNSYVHIETCCDLAGHERVTIGRYMSGEK